METGTYTSPIMFPKGNGRKILMPDDYDWSLGAFNLTRVENNKVVIAYLDGGQAETVHTTEVDGGGVDESYSDEYDGGGV